MMANIYLLQLILLMSLYIADKRIQWFKLILMICFFVFVTQNAINPISVPSGKFLTTGMRTLIPTQIVAPQSDHVILLNVFPKSQPGYDVALSICGIKIDFDGRVLKLELQVLLTNQTQFGVRLTNPSKNLLSSLTISFLAKQPLYTDPFYIKYFQSQNRSQGIKIWNQPPDGQYFETHSHGENITSLARMTHLTFLSGFDFTSNYPNTTHNFDIYIQATSITANQFTIRLSTICDPITIDYYRIVAVFYPLDLIQNNKLSTFEFSNKKTGCCNSELVFKSPPGNINQFNFYVGLKSIHVNQNKNTNFVHFQTNLIDKFEMNFTTYNNMAGNFIKFEFIVILAYECSDKNHFMDSLSNTCDVNCPVNYVGNKLLSLCVSVDCSIVTPNCSTCQQNNASLIQCTGCQSGYALVAFMCQTNNNTIPQPDPSKDTNHITDFDINYQYLTKHPDHNQITLFFSLYPQNTQSYQLYSSIKWSQVFNIDINTTSPPIFQLIQHPIPHLKVTINYAQDLQLNNKLVTLQTYDPSLYPPNFSLLTAKSISLFNIKAQNNLKLKVYDKDMYQMAKVIEYLSLVVGALYLLSMLFGLVLGKVYILQMAAVPQITFISLLCLKNLSPTMTSLSALKYVFGYNYSQNSSFSNFSPDMTDHKSNLGWMGISMYFIQNYNVMFLFTIVTLLIFVVFRFRFRNLDETEQSENVKKSAKIKNLFYLQTPLYLTLWFGLLIFTSGQIQLRNLSMQNQNTILVIIGLAFFAVTLLIYGIYFILFLRKRTQIRSFHDIFHGKNIKNDQVNKTQHFYLLFFVEKIVLGSLLVNLLEVSFLNGIIIAFNLIFIILIVVFKPYKPTDEKQSAQQEEKKQDTPLLSIMKPNIRQIINYIISSLIQALFLITNQGQQNTLALYTPFIVLALLLLNLCITVFFLIHDGVLKRDLKQIKYLCSSERGETYGEELEDTVRKFNTSDMKSQLLKLKSKQINEEGKYKQGNKEQPKSGKSQYNTQLKAEQFNDIEKQMQNQLIQAQYTSLNKSLSIDQMLFLMAQKNKYIQNNNRAKRSDYSQIDQSDSDRSKIKKQKEILRSVKNSHFIERNWNQLENVDSSRMDKLIQFKNAKLVAEKNLQGI